MADQIRHKETRKPYCKPEIERVKLVPEEAVLGGCKTLANGGGIGLVSGSCQLEGCITTWGS
jgi:hypothetical protein